MKRKPSVDGYSGEIRALGVNSPPRVGRPHARLRMGEDSSDGGLVGWKMRVVSDREVLGHVWLRATAAEFVIKLGAAGDLTLPDGDKRAVGDIEALIDSGVLPSDRSLVIKVRPDVPVEMLVAAIDAFKAAGAKSVTIKADP